MFFRDVVVGHLVRLHEIREPHFVGLLAGFARDRIERDFERKADAGARDAAIRQYPRLVGRNRPGAAAIAFHFVRPRQDRADLRSFEARGKRVERIRARIDGGIAIDREQAALAVRIQSDIVVVLAAVGVG